MDLREGEWQYKRVYGLFRTRRAVEAAIEDQSAWGWRLVEVVGDTELRFGRPYQVALKDVGREGNPYATRPATQSRTVPLIAFITMIIAIAAVTMSVGVVRARGPARAAIAAPAPVDSPVQAVVEFR